MDRKYRTKESELHIGGNTSYELVRIYTSDGYFYLEHGEIPKYLSSGDKTLIYKGTHKGIREYTQAEVA